MEAPDVFRTNVRKIMDANGVTMTELAARVGTSRPGVSRILSGEDNVTLPRADRIAKALGCKLTDLLTESENFVHA